MQSSIDGQVLLVTGGNEGIGRAMVTTAAAAGAKVAIFGREQDSMEGVVGEIEAAGGEAIACQVDVTDHRQIVSGVEQVLDRFGRIDALIANAGTNGTWAPVEKLDPQDWDATLRVNLTGTFLTIREVVPAMKRQKGGAIVIVSSVNGTRVFSNQGAIAYAASKGGQLALGKMLALELAPFGIRVNVICPGAIDTHIHDKTEREHLDEIEVPAEFPEGTIPLTGGDMPDPQTVADVAMFLIGDASRHVTGTPIWVDGGESLLEG